MVIIPLFSLDNEEKVIEYLKEYKKITTVIFTDYNERLSDFAIKFRKIKEMFPNIIYGYRPFKIIDKHIFDWIPIDLPDFIYLSKFNFDKISEEYGGKYYTYLQINNCDKYEEILYQTNIIKKSGIIVVDIINNDGSLSNIKIEKIKNMDKTDIYCSIRDYEIDKFTEIKEYFDGFIIEFIYKRNLDLKEILDMFF
jgi:hypothetical protein